MLGSLNKKCSYMDYVKITSMSKLNGTMEFA